MKSQTPLSESANMMPIHSHPFDDAPWLSLFFMHKRDHWDDDLSITSGLDEVINDNLTVAATDEDIGTSGMHS